jgi:hypothetical protein
MLDLFYEPCMASGRKNLGMSRGRIGGAYEYCLDGKGAL